MHLSGFWIFLSQISVYKSQMLPKAHSFFSYQMCPFHRMRGCVCVSFQGLAQVFTEMPSASQCLIQFLRSSALRQCFSCSWSFLAPRNPVGCAEAFMSLLVIVLCCQGLTAHIFPLRARWPLYSSPGTSWRFVNRCRKYCQLCVSDISQLFSWLISLKFFGFFLFFVPAIGDDWSKPNLVTTHKDLF